MENVTSTNLPLKLLQTTIAFWGSTSDIDKNASATLVSNAVTTSSGIAKNHVATFGSNMIFGNTTFSSDMIFENSTVVGKTTLNTTNFTRSEVFDNATLNATANTPNEMFNLMVAMWIFKVGMPIVIIAGVFGNIMIILLQVQISKTDESSLTVYFTALAVSDLCSLTHGTILILERFYPDQILRYRTTCKVVSWLVYVTGMTSAWLLVMLTFQRGAATVWPHQVRVLCTKVKARIVVLAITLLAFATNAHTLYGFDVVSDGSGDFIRTCQFVSAKYQEFFNQTWVLVDILLSSLIPCFLLMISNGTLIVKVCQSLKTTREQLACGYQNSVIAAREKEAMSLTFTLITVSIAFLVLTSPICLLFVIQAEEGVFPVFYAVAYVSWYLNNAINFYLYCLTGSRYRRQLANLFCCRRT